MKEETACYRRLSMLAREQKELLIAGKVEEMPTNTRAQEKQVFALTPIIGRRNDILIRLASLMQMKKLDLKDAVAKAPAEMSQAIREDFDGLTEAAKELSGVEDLSGKLLDNAMKYTQYTLKVIREGGKPRSIPMAMTAEGSKPSFVNRVV
jgi:hypothetical protein